MSANSKILYLFDHADWRSRMPVARAAHKAGYDVTIALLGGDSAADLSDDFRCVHLDVPEGQFRAASLVRMTGRIRALIEEEQPDLIHAVTLKYAFVTGLAARPFRTLRKIYTIAGLGYLFRSEGIKAPLIRMMLSPLLKLTLKARGAHLIFQNPDDLALMIRKKYALAERSSVILGSGVDLERFTPAPLPDDDEPLVLMPTRLVREKGIHIFVEAARILKKRGVRARFQIAGGETTHNPKAVSRQDMLEMTADGAAQWLGRVEDMPGLLAKASLIVYPSYYGEGIPRVLLEACAAGRAIVTTDHPGCREAVRPGENGMLVPVKDALATAQAIETLLSAPDQLSAMGANSRALAEQQFGVGLVAEKTLQVYSA